MEATGSATITLRKAAAAPCNATAIRSVLAVPRSAVPQGMRRQPEQVRRVGSFVFSSSWLVRVGVGPAAGAAIAYVAARRDRC